MTTKQIRQLFSQWQKNNDYVVDPELPLGYDDKRIGWTFTPSYGANLYLEYAENYDKLADIIRSNVQPCLRHADIAYSFEISFDHLSFFHMLTFDEVYTNLDKREDNKKISMIRYFGFLDQILREDKNNIYITACNKGKFWNNNIDKDELFLETYLNFGYLAENIRWVDPTPRESFFFSRAEPFAGPMFEIFYKKDDKEIEIANYYDFQYKRVYKEDGKFAIATNKQQLYSDVFFDAVQLIPNDVSMFGGTFGLERLSLVTEGLDTIYAVDRIEPLVKLLTDLKQDGNLVLEIRRLADLAFSLIKLTNEGVSTKGKGRLGRNARFNKHIVSVIAEDLKKTQISIDEYIQVLRNPLLWQFPLFLSQDRTISNIREYLQVKTK